MFNDLITVGLKVTPRGPGGIPRDPGAKRGVIESKI